jgi:uncharacterized membrane protein YvbJ
MVALCPKCQSVNPDDSSFCYKCGMKFEPKAVPYSISRTELKPSHIVDYTIFGAGILSIIIAVSELIGSMQYSDSVIAATRNLPQELAQIAYDDLNRFLSNMRLVIGGILIFGSVLIVVGYYRIRKITKD